MSKVVPVKQYVKKNGKVVASHTRKTNLKQASSALSRQQKPTSKNLANSFDATENFLAEVASHRSQGKNFYLSGYDLTGMNLEGADLRGCVFTQDTIVNKTNFRKSDLQGVRFDKCKISNSSFDEAFLVRSEFTGSNIRNCSFRNSELDRVQTQRSTFIHSDLTGSTWEQAEISSTKFSNIIAQQMGAPGSSWFDVEMDEVYLEQCDFDDVDFRRVTMKNVDMVSGTLHEARFITVKMDKCDLSGVQAGLFVCEDSTIKNTNLEDMELIDGGFMVSKIFRCSGTSTKFNSTYFKGTSIKESNFSKASFSKTEIDDSLFSGCNFTETSWDGVAMYHSTIENSDCSRSIWENASLPGSSLRNIIWKHAVLSEPDFPYRPHSSQDAEYDRWSFHDLTSSSGLTNKQFEFLVLSGAIEVRDNDNLTVVRAGFDPKKHHIPDWSAQNFIENL